MKVLYFDCFSGISGDMIVGSLLDLGLPFEVLDSELKKLSVKNFSIRAVKVVKSGVAATKFDVQVGHEHAHRNFAVIEKIINESDLDECVKAAAIKVFRRLGEAEATVHGTTLDQIHFHEVGAVDAIVDIVGACIGFHQLRVDQVRVSSLNVGSGVVQCAHGTLPVPAPATAELLKGVPIYSNQAVGELVTPTGAAIISSVASEFGGLPAFKIRTVGYGAGTKDIPGMPNVLRVMEGESQDARDEAVPETLVGVIEANIDDMNPQCYGHLQERLLTLGALDVFATSVQMKKNRPGILLTVICPIPLEEVVIETIFRETTTIGIRQHASYRHVLARQTETVPTDFGDIRVKVSRLKGKIVNFAPEYEDCRAAAIRHNVPLKWMQSRVSQQFLNRYPDELSAGG